MNLWCVHVCTHVVLLCSPLSFPHVCVCRCLGDWGKATESQRSLCYRVCVAHCLCVYGGEKKKQTVMKIEYEWKGFRVNDCMATRDGLFPQCERRGRKEQAWGGKHVRTRACTHIHKLDKGQAVKRDPEGKQISDWDGAEGEETETHFARCLVTRLSTSRFLSGSRCTKQWMASTRDSGLALSVHK